MNVIYGDMDPDRNGMRELLAVSQNNREVGKYITDFQNANAKISVEGAPTERNQIFFFLKFMDESLAKQVSVNDHSLQPWTSLADLIQAARHVGSVTKHGSKSQSQASLTRFWPELPLREA